MRLRGDRVLFLRSRLEWRELREEEALKLSSLEDLQYAVDRHVMRGPQTVSHKLIRTISGNIRV